MLLDRFKALDMLVSMRDNLVENTPWCFLATVVSSLAFTVLIAFSVTVSSSKPLTMPSAISPSKAGVGVFDNVLVAVIAMSIPNFIAISQMLDLLISISE